jgi:hypothetical protein
MGSMIDALNQSNKRAKVYDAQVVTKVPQGVKDLVEEYGAANDESGATVVRWALAEYFEKRGITS